MHQVTERNRLQDVMNQAEEYAARNASQGARELLDWQNSFMLKVGGVVQSCAEILVDGSIPSPLVLAVDLFKNAALEIVAKQQEK